MTPADLDAIVSLIASGVPVSSLEDEIVVSLIFYGFNGSDAELQVEVTSIIEQAEQLAKGAS